MICSINKNFSAIFTTVKENQFTISLFQTTFNSAVFKYITKNFEIINCKDNVVDNIFWFENNDKKKTEDVLHYIMGMIVPTIHD